MNELDQRIRAILESGNLDLLEDIDHAALYQARSRAPKELQALIAPYEHRAFAREATQENPLMALPIAAGIPAYQLYKSFMGARSKPSIDQVKHGLLGIGEGLYGAFRR